MQLAAKALEPPANLSDGFPNKGLPRVGSLRFGFSDCSDLLSFDEKNSKKDSRIMSDIIGVLVVVTSEKSARGGTVCMLCSKGNRSQQVDSTDQFISSSVLTTSR